MNADIVNLDVLFEFFEPSEPDTIREFAASRLFHIARIIGEEVTSPTNSANCK